MKTRPASGVFALVALVCVASSLQVSAKGVAAAGVKVLGVGPDRCGLRMWRDDYMNTNLYARSEHRMGITLRSCADVVLEGIASNESGGDGLYISNRGRNSEPCRNVTVTNGALEVAGAWTATSEELTASPLVAAAGTRLTFGEGATFVPDESLMRGLHTIVIAETAGDGAIEGCPRCDSSDWATRRVQEDGKTRIYLSLRPGFKLILR